MMSMEERANRALNILGKWRVLLTGWQLGTRGKGDPEGDAVRDHREATLMLRAEVTALTAALLAKGVFTQEEYDGALALAAEQLNQRLAEKFPGVTAHEHGLSMTPKAAETMRGWRP